LIALLSNDDGYDSPGLRVLREVLIERDIHVCTAAPLQNHSGFGSARTLNRPIEVLKIMPEGTCVLDGTPCDCVAWGLQRLAKPDIVCTGLNWGDNAGQHAISCSATIAAARVAAIEGIPAIAFSQYLGRHRAFDPNCQQVKVLLHEAMDALPVRPERGVVMNVNLPDPYGKHLGVKVAEISARGGYGGKFHRVRERVWEWGHKRNKGRPKFDAELLTRGYTTVSRLPNPSGL